MNVRSFLTPLFLSFFLEARLDIDFNETFASSFGSLLACHGLDSNDRKAARLDRADGDDGAARVQGRRHCNQARIPKDSELWYRITTDDVDDLMPPAESHKKPFKKEELSLLVDILRALSGISGHLSQWFNLTHQRLR